MEKEKTNFALKRGADQIEQLVAESAKRSKAFEEFVKIKQQEHLVTLFSVEGTSPEMRDKFIRVSQENAMRDLMARSSVPKGQSFGTKEDDVTENEWNHGLIGITRQGVRNVGVYSENTGEPDVFLSENDDEISSYGPSEDSPRTAQKSSNTSGNKMSVNGLLM